MKTYLTLEITHAKPLPDLADRAAGRVYTMDGIDNVEVAKVVVDFHTDSEALIEEKGE